MVRNGASENGEFDIEFSETFSSGMKYMRTKYQGNGREPYQQGEVQQNLALSLQISSFESAGRAQL